MNTVYYFISYIWRHRKPNEDWKPDNCFIDQEPWEWMIELQAQYKEDYRIIFVMKVSQDVYDTWHEKFD